MIKSFCLVHSPCAFGRSLKDDQSQGNMNLWRREASPIRVFHSFNHVRDQPAYFRRAMIAYRRAPFGEHWVAHSGDLENCHRRNMALEAESGNAGERYLLVFVTLHSRNSNATDHFAPKHNGNPALNRKSVG